MASTSPVKGTAFGLLALALIFAGTWTIAASAPTGPENTALSGASRKGVSYGPDELQKLDIYEPVNGSNSNAGLVLIHGGGWTSGKREDLEGVGRMAARRGMVAITIDYRLATGEPDKRWPAQLDDVQMAMGWIRSHASELKIDPNKLCAMGVSAGGQLAVLLAVLQSPATARIACAVDDSGPVDLTTSGYHPPANQLFGPLKRDELAAAERNASPIFLVNRATVPIFVAHGLQDELVPAEQAKQLHEKLQANEVPTALVLYPGGHSWRGLPRQNWLSLIQQELDFVQRHGQQNSNR